MLLNWGNIVLGYWACIVLFRQEEHGRYMKCLWCALNFMTFRFFHLVYCICQWESVSMNLCRSLLQYCKAVNKMETPPPPPPQQRGSLRSFLMFGFSASQAARSTSRADDSQSDASTLVRRSSRVNVNVAPAPNIVDTDAPEIRKYKKRFSSDVLCASLWGMFFLPDCVLIFLNIWFLLSYLFINAWQFGFFFICSFWLECFPTWPHSWYAINYNCQTLHWKFKTPISLITTSIISKRWSRIELILRAKLLYNILSLLIDRYHVNDMMS